MNTTNKTAAMTLIATLLLTTGGGAGYYLALHRSAAATSSSVTNEPKILYYRNPMGLPDTSPTPKKDSMGMDYIPVYEGEDGAAPASEQNEKIAFYRNPMGLPDTSPVPKKDEMGMDYIPVYESELTGGNYVRISTEKIQRLGVKTQAVQEQEMARTVRAVGKLEIDERTVTTISPRFEGWIEKLPVSAVGDQVKRGQVLFEAYSPELFAAEQEYRLAVQGSQSLAKAGADAQDGIRSLSESSLARLKQWEVPSDEIARLQMGGEARATLAYRAPTHGVVLEKSAVQGSRFMPGSTLFKIADLSKVWLQIDLAEQDLPAAQVGNPVEVTLDALPGQTFKGKVDFVYPTLNSETRTAKVRVVLANPNNQLKPGLYAQVQLRAQSTGKHIVVPDSAVIDSGKRQIVLVSVGEGRFESREVQLGLRSNSQNSVLSGLVAGEQIVVSANFLIDAESNLKAALSGMSAAPATSAPASPEHGAH